MNSLIIVCNRRNPITMFNHFSQAERELLQARARQIAANQQTTEASDSQQALRCRVGDGWYAIPLDQLSVIYHDVAVTPVPGAPHHLNGVANVRGRILPVLDLGVLLSVEAASTFRAELIVMEHHEDWVAFQVRQVDDVLMFSAADLELIPEQMQTEATTHALADGTLLLKPDVLLDSDALTIDTQV